MFNMQTEIDYKKLKQELDVIYNQSESPDHKVKVAYHYGHFGFNAVTAKILIELGIDQYLAHMKQLDSIYVNSPWGKNNYSDIQRGNCNFLNTNDYEIVFSNYVNDPREIGIYIQALPFIEYLHMQGKIKSVKINCNERLRELFAKYFPYVQIGTAANKVNHLEIMHYVHATGGASLIRQAIKNISNRIITDKTPRFVGINWFANNIYDRYRSIPIGTLINTVGAHPKNLAVMSLQYNDPKIEIDIYNRYSKNKIIEVFDNDINTTPLEILDAVAQCYCVVGIQSEAIMMAAWLLGIPTIVTASSPNLYWYFLNQLNPNLHIAQMRFAGDYEQVYKNINKWL